MTDTAEAVEEQGGARKAFSFGQTMYHQVKAALGAFALAAFVGHVFHIGWRGFVETLIGYWDEYVRPVTAWIAHTLVTTPLSWVGWHFEVPLLVRDYLSVGTVLFFSVYRSYSYQDSISWRRVKVLLAAWLQIALLWPAGVLVYLFVMVLAGLMALLIGFDFIVKKAARRPFHPKMPTFLTNPHFPKITRSVAPFFYLTALLLLNSLLT